MLNFVKRAFLKTVMPYGKISYSQEGEDIILSRAFREKRNGFYVDVGAHHPLRFSNTYLFYKRGWRGINIDAMPVSITAFKKKRKFDINLELAIAKEPGEIDFFIFKEKAFNTCNESVAKQQISRNHQLESKTTVRCLPLYEVLNKHLPKNTHIDFLTIDVEGSDLDVLESNNWDTYRPTYILAECLNTSIDNYASNPVCTYMESVHYGPYAKLVNTWIFIDRLTT